MEIKYKKQLISEVAEYLDRPRSEVNASVQYFLSLVASELVLGKKVVLGRFGIFSVRERAKRIGTNPKTHKPMEIPNSKYAHFRSSITLKNLLKDE